PGLWFAAVPWLLFPTVAPALTAVSLVVLLLLLFFGPQPDSQPPLPRFSLPQTPINSYVLLLLALIGVAYLVSPVPQVSLPKLTTTIAGVITFFLLLPRLDSPESVKRLIGVLAFFAGLVAVAGFFTLEWPDRQVINLEPITNLLPHLSGSFTVNYNEMAGTLLMFFPFVLAALWKGSGRFKKTIFAAHLIIVLIMLMFTQSRSALLGMAVICLTWFFWGRIPLRKFLPVILLLTVGALLIILVFDLTPSTMSSWLTSVDVWSKQGDAPPTSWLTRLEIWRVAGRMLADYPVIGSGLYAFDPVSRANYLYETIQPSFNLTHTHNLLLQTGTSLGISGPLALIGIWAAALALFWRAGRSAEGEIRRLSAVFASAAAGYLFFNLFDTITFGQKPGLIAWIILAGGIGLSRMADAQRDAVVERPNRLSLGRVAAFVPYLVLVVLLLTPVLPHNLVNLRLDQARLKRPVQLGQANPITVTAADFPNDPRRAGLVYFLSGNETKAVDQWQHDPDSAFFLQLQGTIALTAGNVGDSITWYNLALLLAPDSATTYLWRGIAYQTEGTVALAEADYRKAIEYSAVGDLNDSTRAYIYFRLGEVLAKSENWAESADAFGQATILQPDSSYYYRKLGDTLSKLGDPEAAEAAYERAKETEE
ncbi:MAG: O-antigen ligase family protein, partial [Candidatus Promineifilaceae bacterium]